MKYPYEPKSNRNLEIGEFWPIPLPNGQFGCGIIIGFPDKNRHRVSFIAGLLNWVGHEMPTEETLNIENLKIVESGRAHIKTIKSRGEMIRGKLVMDNIKISKIDDFKMMNTWGYDFINLLAEKLQSEKNSYEKIFSYDWYDGPISGVANRNGKPYFFEYQGYTETAKESYYLTPITNETLCLVIESWEIWKRWDNAFHNGKTGKETHPYLPADKKRGEELEKALKEELKIDQSNYIELYAEFKLAPNQKNVLGMKNIIVKWKEK